MKCSAKTRYYTKYSMYIVCRFPAAFLCYISNFKFPLEHCTYIYFVLSFELDYAETTSHKMFSHNYPGCCAKMDTLFGIILINCAWLNMCCALLNAAHFDWQGV